MAPQTTERPLTAQEAMIAGQRESLEAAAEGKPFEPADIKYGPDTVLGFDTENVGDPSVHNVINSPYLKGMMKRGTAVGGPLEAAQLHGFTEKGRAVNVVDHSGGKATTEPAIDEARQELDRRQQELADREQELARAAEHVGTAADQVEARVRELDERERALDERAADLAEQQQEADRAREAAAAQPGVEPAAEPPAAEPKPAKPAPEGKK